MKHNEKKLKPLLKIFRTKDFAIFILIDTWDETR